MGSSPAWPNPGGAQSGYLVEDGGGRLLLDCGPGVLARLRELDGGWPRIDAVVITHWHLDHWGDLVPWVWGNMVGPGKGKEKPELWVPPEGRDRLRDFGSRLGWDDMFEQAFAISDYPEGEPFRVDAVGESLVLSMHLPFTEKGDVELGRADGELLLAVGSYRRALVLPDSLRRRDVVAARMSGDRLEVEFVAADA